MTERFTRRVVYRIFPDNGIRSAQSTSRPVNASRRRGAMSNSGICRWVARCVIPGCIGVVMCGAGVAHAQTSQTITGWGKVKFGIDENEFKKLFPSTGCAESDPRGVVCDVSGSVTLRSGFRGDLEAIFVNGKLHSLTFSDRGQHGLSEHSLLPTHLFGTLVAVTKEYGAPSLVSSYPEGIVAFKKLFVWSFADHSSIGHLEKPLAVLGLI